MEISSAEIAAFIIRELADITGQPETSFTSDSPLIGPDRRIKSGELVGLLLAIEDFAEGRMDKRFDWNSDSAMSEAKSIFRTVGTLAAHVAQLQNR
jgi:hypothetical protein